MYVANFGWYSYSYIGGGKDGGIGGRRREGVALFQLEE